MIMCLQNPIKELLFHTKTGYLLPRILLQKLPNYGLKIWNSRFKIQKEKYESAISLIL